MTRAAAARWVGVAVLVLAGPVVATHADAPPTIVCIGDSITAGIVRGAQDPADARRDPAGGYPGRLQRRFGARAHVVNRGLPGGSARIWLLDPAGDGAIFWDAVQRAFPDLDTSATIASPSILLRVLAADRPNVVVIMLGSNDLSEDPDDPQAAAKAAERLAEVVRQARTRAPIVLIATVPPNRRDPRQLQTALNDLLRATEPDVLDVGRRFSAAGWRRLLGDDIHPNARGHALIARVIGRSLLRRGYVERRESASRR